MSLKEFKKESEFLALTALKSGILRMDTLVECSQNDEDLKDILEIREDIIECLASLLERFSESAAESDDANDTFLALNGRIRESIGKIRWYTRSKNSTKKSKK